MGQKTDGGKFLRCVPRVANWWLIGGLGWDSTSTPKQFFLKIRQGAYGYGRYSIHGAYGYGIFEVFFPKNWCIVCLGVNPTNPCPTDHWRSNASKVLLLFLAYATLAALESLSETTPTYPIPQASPKPPNENSSFIKCWLRVWGREICFPHSQLPQLGEETVQPVLTKIFF